MRQDDILKIGIDERGSLYLQPASSKFAYIYREAMEVGWDPQRGCLFSPVPREWTYLRWFRQLRDAAREQGVMLKLGPTTVWENVPANVREEIEAIPDNVDPMQR